jgi:hypothetical protein
MVLMPLILATRQLVMERNKAQGQPRQKVSEIPSQTRIQARHPTYARGIVRRAILGWPKAKTGDQTCKIKKKMTGGVSQEVVHLPGKCKALRSNPSAAKKKKKEISKTKMLHSHT